MRLRVRVDRFIPARAGNTSQPMAATPASAVHPRSRGEHFHVTERETSIAGSSPLARGTRGSWRLMPRPARFIPARAGNTRLAVNDCDGIAVHPRSRGEHKGGHHATRAPCGSSPLARGTQGVQRVASPRRRFIPARAGNTRRDGYRQVDSPVHPRSRGEHWRRPDSRRRRIGSSPLARGTHHDRRGDLCPLRFIPARAGNTAINHALPRLPPVHPRSRGEHYGGRGSGKSHFGSSPLARGTRGSYQHGCCDRRFIPARAGNTGRFWWRVGRQAVHPRSRGEHDVA